MRTSILALFATCALAWSHDQPNDLIAVDDAIYVAQADQINRVLRGNDPQYGPQLSKHEKSGQKWGRRFGKAAGGGVGMAAGAAGGMGIGMAAGPGGMIAGATAGGVAGRLVGELGGIKAGTSLGEKIGRMVANHKAKQGPKILKTLTERNPELKAVSDKKSRISLNQPRPLMQRITRSNSAPSSVSLDKGPKPAPKKSNERQPNPASKTNRQKMLETKKNGNSARRK
ncbi:hypothetical protein AC1031_012367 [Aphanomyces cochlioides]|nr:hypothetical protein AC1031_012367 [Aphanomyces cochlioides]